MDGRVFRYWTLQLVPAPNSSRFKLVFWEGGEGGLYWALRPKTKCFLWGERAPKTRDGGRLEDVSILIAKEGGPARTRRAKKTVRAEYILRSTNANGGYQNST